MENGTKVAVLERDVAHQSAVLQRLETTIERLGDVSNSVAKMLSVHEEKHTQHQDVQEELYALVEKQSTQTQEDVRQLHGKIERVESSLKEAFKTGIAELKETITGEHQTMNQTNKDHEDRIRRLERWKWMMIGGSGLAGAIAMKILEKIWV